MSLNKKDILGKKNNPSNYLNSLKKKSKPYINDSEDITTLTSSSSTENEIIQQSPLNHLENGNINCVENDENVHVVDNLESENNGNDKNSENKKKSIKIGGASKIGYSSKEFMLRNRKQKESLSDIETNATSTENSSNELLIPKKFSAIQIQSFDEKNISESVNDENEQGISIIEERKNKISFKISNPSKHFVAKIGKDSILKNRKQKEDLSNSEGSNLSNGEGYDGSNELKKNSLPIIDNEFNNTR